MEQPLPPHSRIDCRFKIHDRFQIEYKIKYPLSDGAATGKVRLEWYLHLPSALGIHAATYSKADFYQDLQVYSRYSTPSLSMLQILDEQNELSPLTRLKRFGEQLGANPSDQALARASVYEIRVMSCVLRERIQEGSRAVRLRLKAARKKGDSDLGSILEQTGLFLDQLGVVAERVTGMRRVFARLPLPEVIRAFELLDEMLHIGMEDESGRLYQAYSRLAASQKEPGLQAPVLALAHRLSKTMAQAESHRIQSCYPSILVAGDDPASERGNEYFIYRVGVLKRFAQSVLFLNVHTDPGSRSALYSLNALAAMGAMLAYLVLVILFLPNPQSTSLSALVLLVVAYAFKDRIKEGLKAFFSERMTGMLRDRETHFIDRAREHVEVGHAAEAVLFVPAERIPDSVRELRAQDELSQWASDGAPESVLKYQRSVTIFNARISRIRERANSVTEILRLNVRRLLYRMDEPRKRLVKLKPLHLREAPARAPSGGPPADGLPLPPLAGTRRPLARLQAPAGLLPMRPVHAAKVYHANLILRLLTYQADGTEAEQLRKYRLILSRRGIKRVEAEEGLPAVYHPPRE